MVIVRPNFRRQGDGDYSKPKVVLCIDDAVTRQGYIVLKAREDIRDLGYPCVSGDSLYRDLSEYFEEHQEELFCVNMQQSMRLPSEVISGLARANTLHMGTRKTELSLIADPNLILMFRMIGLDSLWRMYKNIEEFMLAPRAEPN